MNQKLLLISAVTFISMSARAQWVQASSITDSDIQTVVASGNTVYAGGANDGVWRSTNGGSTWTNLQSGLTDPDVYAIDFVGQTVYAGTYSGVFSSINGGNTWSPASTGLTNNDVNTLAIKGSSLFAGTMNGIFMSSNNGNSWTAKNTGLPTNPGSIQSFMINGSDFYVCTANYGLFVSTDNGNSWTAKNNGITDTYVTSVVAKGSKLFASTMDDGVFVSTDNGANWTAMNNGLPVNLSIRDLIVGGSYLFAAADGGVHASNDDGASWKDFNQGLLYFQVQDFAVTATHVFLSNDGGKVWGRPIADGISIGVNEYKQNHTVSIYPNPCHAGLNISVAESQGTEKQINIYDLQGKLTVSHSFLTAEDRLDLAGLTAGLYVYTIQQNGVMVANGKLAVE